MRRSGTLHHTSAADCALTLEKHTRANCSPAAAGPHGSLRADNPTAQGFSVRRRSPLPTLRSLHNNTLYYYITVYSRCRRKITSHTAQSLLCGRRTRLPAFLPTWSEKYFKITFLNIFFLPLYYFIRLAPVPPSADYVYYYFFFFTYNLPAFYKKKILNVVEIVILLVWFISSIRHIMLRADDTYVPTEGIIMVINTKNETHDNYLFFKVFIF